jgi:alanine racemase
MQGIKRFIEQSVEIKHVRAAARKQRLDDSPRRIRRMHFAPCEIYEECSPLRRELRFSGQLADEAGDAVANGHRIEYSALNGRSKGRLTPAEVGHTIGVVITRRRFLSSSALVPLFGSPSISVDSPPAAGSTTDPVSVASTYDPWIELNTSHLRHNVGEVARQAGGRPILAVIKNNGYGLGVANVARLLEPQREIAGFAVVKLHEAVTLRDVGVKKPVLLMSAFTDDELAKEIAPRGITPMVFRDCGTGLDAAAAATRDAIAVHVKVDTGMNRLGVPHREAAALIRSLAARRSVRIDGVMTVLTEDEAFDREQIARLTSLCDDLTRNGVPVGRRHAASSFALFQNPGAFLDMVRPGMALYGIYSEPQFRLLKAMDLRPAVALRTRVVRVAHLQIGDSAGYNRAYVAGAPVWIATLPVGHADGWPRVAAKGARVRINGVLYPVVASVSASHTIVEIGPERRVEVGDIATLFDWEEGSRPEDVADACGASVYDLTMHLSSLLTRRIVEI